MTTTDEYPQVSLMGGPSGSDPSTVCEVGVLLVLQSFICNTLITFWISLWLVVWFL